jgi:hypothetical protein
MDLTSRERVPGKASRHKCDHDGQAAETTPFSFRAGLSAFIEEEISMTLKSPMTRPVLNASFLLVVLLSLFFNPVSALADGKQAALPNFSDFSQTVQNGEAEVLRGVYVADALRITTDK